MNRDQQNLKNPRSWGVFLATGVLILSLVFVAATFFLLARNAQHEQEWISRATDVQVTSQQLAKSAGEAAAGNLDAFLELGTSRSAIAAAMGILRSGSVANSLPPTPKAVSVPMKQLNQSWGRMSTNASSILEREKLIMELATARKIVQDNIPGIQKNTDTSISALTRSGAPTNQLVFASRQLVLADRILRRVSEVLRGGSDAVKAAESLAKERLQFEQVLNSLLRGNSKLGVTQVRNAEALQSLGKVKSLFENIKPQIDNILDSSSDLFEEIGRASCRERV
jgi:twitching motility protein PilJ